MISEQHLDRLRRLYTDAPSSLYGPEDIGVWAGQARIQFQTEDEDRDATGAVDRALYFKLLSDAAALAAGSLVEDRFVTSESLDLYFIRSVNEGEIVAMAQVVSARGNLFKVEALLTDGNGRKLARAHGIFTKSTVHLPDAEEGEDSLERDSEDDMDLEGTVWDSPYGPMHLN